jgi:histidinol-phosphate/aromatic aminotransferase/cobyric acid decarboxylase-like protein/choline kinase
MVQKAIILSAGLGSRLRPLTDRLPKPLVQVNGVPILENALRHLSGVGVREAVLVTGHGAEQIVEKFGPQFLDLRLSYVHNPRYATTNNIVSLGLAVDHLREDVLLLEGDVYFEKAVLTRLLERPEGNLAAVDDYQAEMDGTAVQVKDVERFRRSGVGEIDRFLLGQHRQAGLDRTGQFKTVNLYLFREDFLRRYLIPQLEAFLRSGEEGQYYEIALAAIALTGRAKLTAVGAQGLRWKEIDDRADLEAAEYLFAPPEQRYEKVTAVYGSYQRFDFVDHSHVYNPYFPAPRMYEELGRQLRELVIHYPAGQDELAELVSRWTYAPREQIVVANGGAELIKALGAHFVQDLTLSVPSYNEYENSVSPQRVHRVPLGPEALQFDGDRFCREVQRSRSNVAVVVSPNNPTSLAVPKDALVDLLRQLEALGCLLVVDESFLDFCADARAGTLQDEAPHFPNLLILKSLTKGFGCLGLRLGYGLSADLDLVKALRKHLPVFNVNGLAEAFLRMLPRFRKDFEASCARVRAETDQLYEGLHRIPWLRCVPPDANFVFCRVDHPHLDGVELTRRLFLQHRVLIKHCAGKSLENGDRFVRVASRSAPENAALVQHLRAVGEEGFP